MRERWTARIGACGFVAALTFVWTACGESSNPSADDSPGDAGESASGGSTSTGGASTGGANTGGASTGGASTGGASTGGASTGGAGGDGGTTATGGSTATGGAGGGNGGTSGMGTGGSAGASGSGARAGAGGAAGSCENCDWQCCGDTCVNMGNDVKNCGACGLACPEGQSCNDGACGPPPCEPNVICIGTTFCCGTSCCPLGNICCVVPGPVGPSLPQCFEPDARGTCPLGCRTCRCASPETPVATPDGERPIADLRVGDLVYSVDDLATVAVPIVALHRQPAEGHAVPRIVLDDGRMLDVSAGHPTADGRTFGDLQPGDRLGERTVARVTYVAYRHPFTYDILPDSSTGTYFAAGALIGSTLASLPQSMAP